MMQRISPREGPVQLVGFNNLTKALSFNLYDFCVARNQYERDAYVKYIHNRFNAQKVTGILHGICDIIEARVLSVSDQDYSPWGASSMMLMSDAKGSGVALHVDKSHICAHTYPDFRENGKICSFRIDIDISTRGEISPLKALNFMFTAFDSDVVVVDYVVRGYTRDSHGRRIYMDHQLQSIQSFIDAKVLKDYHAVDLVLQSDNIWQTKMLRTNVNEQSYFLDPVDTSDPDVRSYLDLVKGEMRGILYMWPE